MLSLFSWSMYFLSFTPLWLAVLFIDSRSMASQIRNRGTEIISILCILLGMVVALFVLVHCLRKARKEDRQECILSEAKEQKSVTADFILAYILPLLAFDFTKWDQVVLFLIFFVTLGLLCIRHNYLILNVILDLMRYRFYECIYLNADNTEIHRTVISQQRLNARIGLGIKVYPLNDDYALDQFSMHRN